LHCGKARSAVAIEANGKQTSVGLRVMRTSGSCPHFNSTIELSG
jgi:hypothetical protein